MTILLNFTILYLGQNHRTCTNDISIISKKNSLKYLKYKNS